MTLADLLDAVRAYVRANLPGDAAVEVRVNLASGRKVLHPVPFASTPGPPSAPGPATGPAPRPAPPPARHGPDFRSVHWFGADYAFSPTQAAIVRTLWDAWERGVPAVGHDTLLEESGSEGRSVADILRGHPAMGTMIVRVGRTYQLSEPA